jgi:apolipoprotein N-acyltransferase
MTGSAALEHEPNQRDSASVQRFSPILALVAGLASATGFAPLGLWPLTLACFALLIQLVRDARTMRGALLTGWLFGVGHFTVGLNWIAHAFTFQDAMPHAFGYGAVVLLSLYLAVYPAMAAGLAWRWGRGHALSQALIWGAAWIVTEWLRATMFTGFAWNPLAAAAMDTPLASWSMFVGTYGVSGLVVLLAGLLGNEIARWRRNALAPLHTAIGVIAVLLIASVPALLNMGAEPPPGRLIRVVQPNIGQETKYDPAQDAINFRKLASLSGKPGPEPRLLLWPEAAVPEYLDEEPWARAQIAALLGPRDIVLTGATKRHRSVTIKDGAIEERTIGGRNSVYAMDRRGTLIHRYDKAHLVPYGEYLPMRPVLSAIGLSRLVPGDIDFWPGPGAQSYDLPGFGRIGMQICYEVIFSGQVIERGKRPDFLFNPSNDAWFGSWGPPQHLAQARLRAIEEGLPVVRSTPTGISAVVDAEGRLLASIPHHEAGAIEMRLPGAHAPTLFARFGNILPFILAIILGGAAIALRRRAR